MPSIGLAFTEFVRQKNKTKLDYEAKPMAAR